MEKRVSLVVVVCLILSFLVVPVYAEKIDIVMGNSYLPGEDVSFKIILYDDENNKIDGQVNYVIQDYYTEIMGQGSSSSGDEVNFKIPENAIQGPWKIVASYNTLEVNRLFNVGELAKAEIVLQGDILTLRNIGNAVYNKKILIYIGQNDQTADVYLDIGQVKKIRLTAPDGKYDIRVIEGNEEQVLEFSDVILTGNVIGLERVFGEGFWQRYPIVGVFLIALLLVVVVVSVLKFVKKEK